VQGLKINAFSSSEEEDVDDSAADTGKKIYRFP